MFVPLRDQNPLRIIPFEFVNVSLIAICIAVFVVFQSGLVIEAGMEQYSFALVPIELLTPSPADLFDNLAYVPDDVTVVTYMFMHGGWLHLLANMLFLWVLGDNIEDDMGHLTYLAFFILCGIAAGLAHTLAHPESSIPLVGASGAIAGVVGAYLILHPRVRIWVLVLWRLPIPIPAYLALGTWVALQVISIALSPDDEVAWFAHLGGLAAGLVLTPMMKRRAVPLFGRGVPH
jgi:membrane associated rhomboid family serine protease